MLPIADSENSGLCMLMHSTNSHTHFEHAFTFNIDIRAKET